MVPLCRITPTGESYVLCVLWEIVMRALAGYTFCHEAQYFCTALFLDYGSIRQHVEAHINIVSRVVPHSRACDAKAFSISTYSSSSTTAIEYYSALYTRIC